MRLSRRWKIGLLISGYVVLVLAMAWYSLPNAFRGADRFRDYQEGLSRQMAERAAQSGRAAAAEAPPAPDPAE